MENFEDLFVATSNQNQNQSSSSSNNNNNTSNPFSASIMSSSSTSIVKNESDSALFSPIVPAPLSFENQNLLAGEVPTTRQKSNTLSSSSMTMNTADASSSRISVAAPKEISYKDRKVKSLTKDELMMFPSIIDGIKKIYASKVKPVETTYLFDQFHSQCLRDSDFEAKPMVLLLGQYSTGKSSFIRYLLGKDYPGMHIGPEPTTDRFVAVMGGDDDMEVPGNALAVQADKPFSGLSRFGIDFLNKFQGSQTNSPILNDITLIDTPGVLSGEKQRLGRSYDFAKVCEWFAERSDLILLLFDAHKLDISDEFKRVIEGLKSNSDKIRIVLNKADMISGQQLMRVYGALMWSLGKVLQTPEVTRVFIGSFWEKPYQIEENAKLFDAEREDLFKDLFSLPKYSAIRRVNELVKRSRVAKVHAFIISHLNNEMPSFFGKDKKKEELIQNLKNEFFKIHQKFQLPVGDFPEISRFKEQLKLSDFGKFPKLNLKMIEQMDQVLAEDIPKLMKQFPYEKKNEKNSLSLFLNDSQINDPKNAHLLNPFLSELSSENSQNPEISADFPPLISNEQASKWHQVFLKIAVNSKVPAHNAKPVLMQSKLPSQVLSKIWSLSDRDGDGQLTEQEFFISMYLIQQVLTGKPLPNSLDPNLIKQTMGLQQPQVNREQIRTSFI